MSANYTVTLTTIFKNKIADLITQYRNITSYVFLIATVIVSTCMIVRKSILIYRLWKKNHAPKPPANQQPNLVPERWSNDLILEQFKCAINHLPTLSPATDPKLKTVLYDSSSLYVWWGKHRTTPLGSPASIKELLNCRKYIIEGLIHHRIEQLKLLETELGCELSPEKDQTHKELMEKSARELDSKIRPLLSKPIEETVKEMQEIPPFLDGHGKFWHPTCAGTGKPIRYALYPKLSEDILEKDESLAGICYEKKYIEDLLATQPNTLPNQWPIQHLPFLRSNLEENRHITYSINFLVTAAIKQLRQYYTLLS